MRGGELGEQVVRPLEIALVVEPHAEHLVLVVFVDQVGRVNLKVEAVEHVLDVVLRTQAVEDDELEPRRRVSLHHEERTLDAPALPCVLRNVVLVKGYVLRKVRVVRSVRAPLPSDKGTRAITTRDLGSGI